MTTTAISKYDNEDINRLRVSNSFDLLHRPVINKPHFEYPFEHIEPDNEIYRINTWVKPAPTARKMHGINIVPSIVSAADVVKNLQKGVLLNAVKGGFPMLDKFGNIKYTIDPVTGKRIQKEYSRAEILTSNALMRSNIEKIRKSTQGVMSSEDIVQLTMMAASLIDYMKRAVSEEHVRDLWNTYLVIPPLQSDGYKILESRGIIENIRATMDFDLPEYDISSQIVLRDMFFLRKVTHEIFGEKYHGFRHFYLKLDRSQNVDLIEELNDVYTLLNTGAIRPTWAPLRYTSEEKATMEREAKKPMDIDASEYVSAKVPVEQYNAPYAMDVDAPESKYPSIEYRPQIGIDMNIEEPPTGAYGYQPLSAKESAAEQQFESRRLQELERLQKPELSVPASIPYAALVESSPEFEEKKEIEEKKKPHVDRSRSNQIAKMAMEDDEDEAILQDILLGTKPEYKQKGRRGIGLTRVSPQKTSIPRMTISSSERAPTEISSSVVKKLQQHITSSTEKPEEEKKDPYEDDYDEDEDLNYQTWTAKSRSSTPAVGGLYVPSSKEALPKTVHVETTPVPVTDTDIPTGQSLTTDDTVYGLSIKPRKFQARTKQKLSTAQLLQTDVKRKAERKQTLASRSMSPAPSNVAELQLSLFAKKARSVSPSISAQPFVPYNVEEAKKAIAIPLTKPGLAIKEKHKAREQGIKRSREPVEFELKEEKELSPAPTQRRKGTITLFNVDAWPKIWKNDIEWFKGTSMTTSIWVVFWEYVWEKNIVPLYSRFQTAHGSQPAFWDSTTRWKKGQFQNANHEYRRQKENVYTHYISYIINYNVESLSTDVQREFTLKNTYHRFINDKDPTWIQRKRTKK